MRYRLVLSGCLLVLASAVCAEDLWPNQRAGSPQFKKYQVSVGVATQIWHDDSVNPRPMVMIEGLRFLTRSVALKLEVGYIPTVGNDRSSEASTLTTSAGFRLQANDGLLRPYFEGDFGSWRLSGTRFGHEFSEKLIAIGLTVGASVKVGGDSFLEFGWRPVMNELGSYSYPNYSPTTPPLPPDQEENWDMAFGYDGLQGLRGLYNTTHVFIRYRFGL